MRARPLENLIAKIRVRCPHAADEDEPAHPAGRMTVAQLLAALAERALPQEGLKQELVDRLEAARGDDVGPCAWTGTISALGLHLRACPRDEVACPHEGCEVSLMRCWMARHAETCEYRRYECQHCGDEVRDLVRHMEEDCDDIPRPCPENCGANISWNAFLTNTLPQPALKLKYAARISTAAIGQRANS